MKPPTPSSTPTPSSCQVLPSTRIVPESGRISPNNIRRNVVLPAPFGPSTPYTSPAATRRERSSTARTVPKALVTPVASTAN